MQTPRNLALGALAALFLASGMSAARLDLTTEQRDSIRRIVERHRSEGLDAAIGKAREAKHEAARVTRDPTAEEASVRDALRKASAASEDLAVMRHALRAEVYSVLTPEQQAKAKERGMRGRRGMRRTL